MWYENIGFLPVTKSQTIPILMWFIANIQKLRIAPFCLEVSENQGVNIFPCKVTAWAWNLTEWPAVVRMKLMLITCFHSLLLQLFHRRGWGGDPQGSLGPLGARNHNKGEGGVCFTEGPPSTERSRMGSTSLFPSSQSAAQNAGDTIFFYFLNGRC